MLELVDGDELGPWIDGEHDLVHVKTDGEHIRDFTCESMVKDGQYWLIMG